MLEFTQPGAPLSPGRAAGCGRGRSRRCQEPLPGQHPRLPPHPRRRVSPTAPSFPGGRRVRPAPGERPARPRVAGRSPVRDLKHRALELQLPGARPFPGIGAAAPPAAAARRPLRVPPGPLSRGRHRCAAPAPNPVRLRPAPVAPSAAGPALTSFRGPTAGPRAYGPSSAAVSARATAAATAHFRFPRSARAASAARESPQSPSPPGSTPPRSAPPREPSLGCAHARAPRPRRPTPASARGKGNRRRLAVSARAHARAEGEDDCAVGSGAPPYGQRKYGGPGPGPADPTSAARSCSSPRQTFHSTLAHLVFILLDSPPVRSFPSGLFHHPFKEGGHTLKNVRLLP